jgi:hypothetical protein
MLESSIYGVNVHSRQGALQCKISAFLVVMVRASAPNIELRDLTFC